jgi:hypothetical protein
VVRESGDRVWAFRFADLEGKRAQTEFARAELSYWDSAIITGCRSRPRDVVEHICLGLQRAKGTNKR